MARQADCRPHNRRPSDCVTTYTSNIGILGTLTFKIKLCLSDNIWIFDLMSFSGHINIILDSVASVWRSRDDERQSISVVKTGNRQLFMETNRVYEWVTHYGGSVVLFARRPLVHVYRMVERRAHRKEFRRKGC